jgi:menaquinone-dependent protoporphyrinogen oxidase
MKNHNLWEINMKALVVYGSRYGTSAEIAEDIAKTLKEENVKTDLVNSRDMKEWDISPYDLVVAGSGIKMGKWTKASLKFLDKNRLALANKKVALFVSCGAANKEKTLAEGQKNI